LISYIFKNKTKNIIVAILAAILIVINLETFRDYLFMRAWKQFILHFLPSFISYWLILIYMLTLKREYKLKPLLFPTAFALLSLHTTFSISLNPTVFFSLSDLIIGFISFVMPLLATVGYVFCFVGSLSNFKKLSFMRLGLSFSIANVLILCLYDLYLYYLSKENLLLFYVKYILNLNEVLAYGIELLFYISLLVLTITKESENIDIKPFIEARKLKKQLKKEAKLKQITDEMEPITVEDGFWRCMGCGEILPDNINECECGYKR